MSEFNLKGLLEGNWDSLFEGDAKIEAPYVIVFSGDPGTLKSTICEYILDKDLERTKGKKKALYITFEQTEKSLIRTMEKLGIFKNVPKPGKGESSEFEIWDVGKVTEDYKNRIKIVDKIMETHKDKPYKEFEKFIKKHFKDRQEYIEYNLLKKTYDVLADIISEEGHELTPGSARAKLRKEAIPDKYIHKVWPKMSREPTEPKATIEYPQTILNVIEDYKEEYADKFYLVAIDSLHAMFLRISDELEEEGHPNPDRGAKKMLYGLMKNLHKHNIITLLVAEEGGVEEKLLAKHKFLADGTVRLSMKGGQRRIQIEKMREVGHDHAVRLLSLDKKKGLVVKGIVE